MSERQHDPDTLVGVLRAAESYLRERGVEAPRLSVELLAGHVLGMSRMRLYLEHDRPVSEAERAALRPLVARRGQHEPVSYLLGHQEFFGLALEVGPDVLIPRPETEGLVELAIERAPERALCIDLCTGSGAVAVALAARRPDVSVLATDVSAPALAVARRNVARHGVQDRVRLLAGDYWQALAAGTMGDLLVANPPYVDPAMPELLADDVRRYEPALALLTPPGDPAAPYRAIVAGLPGRIRPGGWVLLETGVGAAELAFAVLESADWLSEAALVDDLAGLPRYLTARVH